MYTIIGTEGSVYQSVAEFNEVGAVGYRDLGDNEYRVRVVPFNGNEFYLPNGWKQPGKDQNRYSKRVKGSANLVLTLQQALDALEAVFVENNL